MNVMPETAAGKFEYKGKTYYFCNPRCLERFRANPEQFLSPAPVFQIAGMRVIGGTINGAGGFVMRAERVGRDTFCLRPVRFVRLQGKVSQDLLRAMRLRWEI